MLKAATMGANSTRGIGKYMSMALLLPISTGVGFAMGYGLDMLFHTTFLRWVFVVLGTISGFISLLRELEDDEKRGS
jgi:F0F1-type ATP synthase assembly protein I